MKVIKSKVLVSVLESAETVKKTESGIILPAEANVGGNYEEAVVRAVGSEVGELTEGDRIYIYKGAGTEFEIAGDKFRVISPADIIVIL